MANLIIFFVLEIIYHLIHTGWFAFVKLLGINYSGKFSYEIRKGTNLQCYNSYLRYATFTLYFSIRNTWGLLFKKMTMENFNIEDNACA